MSTSPTSAGDSTSQRGRWPIAFLLAFGVIVNFFDRINLSVSQEALHASFGLTLISFGYLSSAFSWSYAAMQVPAGLLLDRFGVRRVGRITTFLWSVASFCAALSTGLVGLFAARLLLGVAESPTFPANAKAIGLWFQERERSLAIAVTDAAAKLSSAIGVPLIGILLLHFGWRWSFAATGFISLIYFALFCRIYRDPASGHSPPAAQPESHTQGNERQNIPARAAQNSRFRYLVWQRKVIGLAIGWGAYNYTFFLLLTWLPKYLSYSLHVDLLHSVFYTSVPWLFAATTDFVVGGWLVDFLIQRGWNATRVRQTVLLIGTSLGLAIWGAGRAHSPATALIWISIALGGLAAAAPVAWTVPSLIAPQGAVGTVGGLANFCGQLSAISAPIVTGYIVTATHSFAAAFAIATLVLLLGIASYVFLLGRMERIPEPPVAS
ncbi:MAG TPA: MFS transporter [Candidatus Acidoferrum sp.]|nr:MFS transporter [Candidatus Acidoferrum sp.]